MKRRGRTYTKRIQIWQNTSQTDGFGGNVVGNDTLIAESWAEVKTVSNNSRYTSRLTDLGITDPQNAIIVKFRSRNDITYNAINQYLVYRNEKYTIQNLTNIDLLDNDIEIIAVRQQTESVPELTPIV